MKTPGTGKAKYHLCQEVYSCRTSKTTGQGSGIGNFMGLLPEGMEGVRMYGVELDGISGRIAQQFYQNNTIAIQGFETTDYPDNFFDFVIGNVPFGNYKVSDRKYDRYNFMIHDYFIAKSLDLIRPGGVIAVVTSSGTMDKQNPSVRKYIADRADLLGAIRLPNNAFQRNANTSVVADILFFQKRDHAVITQPEWVNLGVTSEGTKKTLKQKLEKLNNQERKDNVVTFEQLGVDHIFVDESHYYKNAYFFTKMRNVAGIAQTDAQKCSDLFMKCQYLDEITGGREITFATGTPVSNSVVELYTMMRYLQFDTLQKMGLGHFDSWEATFFSMRLTATKCI